MVSLMMCLQPVGIWITRQLTKYVFDQTSGASARRGSARELVQASGVIGAGPGSGVGE